jgi:drug/metabolite transporter (DMT)-like permease
MEKRRKNLILIIIALIILMLIFIDYDTSNWKENWGNYLGIGAGLFLLYSLVVSSSKKEE